MLFGSFEQIKFRKQACSNTTNGKCSTVPLLQLQVTGKTSSLAEDFVNGVWWNLPTGRNKMASVNRELMLFDYRDFTVLLKSRLRV